MATKKAVTKKAVTKKAAVKKVATKKVATKKVATKTATKKVVAKSVETKSTTFEIFSPDSNDVFLAGSFNGWEMLDMKKSKSGVWSVKVSLSVGEHQYKYVFEGISWEIDPAAPAISSEQGLNNLVIVK